MRTGNRHIARRDAAAVDNDLETQTYETYRPTGRLARESMAHENISSAINCQ